MCGFARVPIPSPRAHRCVTHQHYATSIGVTHQPDDAQRVVHATLICVLARTYTVWNYCIILY
jgi:hypothetical protein